MEQGFKIAIWMLCLIGYLQAIPVTTQRSEVEIDDLGCFYLQMDVKCGNENFTHPTNVEKSCRHAAFQHYIGQLELAQKKCDDVHERINGTLETLEERVLPLVSNNISTCQLETTTSQFDKFVDAIKVFANGVNTKPNQTESGK